MTNSKEKQDQLKALTHTLQESQQELASLVAKYDQSTQDCQRLQQEIMAVKLQVKSLEQDIYLNKQKNEQLTHQVESQERELQEVYTTLARKEEASKQIERKFSALVREKDNENITLKIQIEKLEQTKEDELAKIARLEREMRQTVQAETEKLNNILNQKN